jgi:5-methylcytosine-specific restriction protein A
VGGCVVSAVPVKTRLALFERAAGHCEVDGIPLSGIWHGHHRRPRRLGGSRRPDTHSLSNLLATCGPCNLFRIERNRPWAYEHGYLLHDRQVPAETPVFIYGAGWVLLTPTGLYEPVVGGAA